MLATTPGRGHPATLADGEPEPRPWRSARSGPRPSTRCRPASPFPARPRLSRPCGRWLPATDGHDPDEHPDVKLLVPAPANARLRRRVSGRSGGDMDPPCFGPVTAARQLASRTTVGPVTGGCRGCAHNAHAARHVTDATLAPMRPPLTRLSVARQVLVLQIGLVIAPGRRRDARAVAAQRADHRAARDKVLAIAGRSPAHRTSFGGQPSEPDPAASTLAMSVPTGTRVDFVVVMSTAEFATRTPLPRRSASTTSDTSLRQCRAARSRRRTAARSARRCARWFPSATLPGR